MKWARDAPRHSRRQFMARIAATSAVIVIGSQVIPVKRLLPSSFGAASADAGIAAFAQGVDLASRCCVHRSRCNRQGQDARRTDSGDNVRLPPQEHDAAFGAAAGSAAVTQPNPKLLAAVGGQLSGTADERPS